MSLPIGDPPIFPESETGWIMIVVTIFMSAVIVPASFSHQAYTVDPSKGIIGIIIAAGTFAFTAISVVIGTFASIIKKIINKAYVLLILVLLLQGQIMLNNFDHNIIEASDNGATKYFLPAFRSVGLPVARFAQISYDMSICWFDLNVMWRNIIINEVADIVIDCSAQDWNDVVNKTVTAIGNIVAIPIYFIQDDGKQPFEIEQALYSVGTAINSIRPTFECSCEELHIFYDIFFDPIIDANLSYALDRAVNIVAYYPLNITTWAIAYAFNGQGPTVYLCDNQPTINSTIACAIVRPPDFKPLQQAWCEMANYTGFWVENTVTTIIEAFISEWYTGLTLEFHNVFAATTCMPVHLLLDLVDVITHIDLIIDTKVLYLKYATFNDLINVANQFCDGVEEFWNGFNDQITTDIGVALGEGSRIIFMTIQMLGQFLVALIDTIITESQGDNDNEFVDLIQDYNTAPFSVSWNMTKLAIIDIMNQINTYTGSLTNELLSYFQSIFDVYFSVIQTLAVNASSRKRFNIDGINNYVLNILPAKANTTILHFHGIYVALGNWFRQFDETNSCVYGALDPPVVVVLTNPTGHILCYLGNICETIGQIGRSFGDQLSSAMFAIYYDISTNQPVSAASPYIQQINNWIQDELINVYTNLIQNYAGTVASVFGPVQCPCATGPGCSTGCTGLTGCNNTESTLISEVFYNISYDFLDFGMGLVFHFFEFLFNVIVTILGDTSNFTASDGAQLVCEFTQFFIDIFGRMFKIFKSLGDFLDCLIGNIPSGGNINVVSGTLYWVLFDPNNATGMRNGICTAIETMFQILEYIINFIDGLFTQGIAYFAQQAETAAKVVVNDLIDSINSLINNDINGQTLSGIQTALNSLLVAVRTLICFINNIISVFTALEGLSQTTTFSLSFQIPALNLGSIDLNFGLLGSWDINLGSINFPYINLGSITFPDPQAIVNTIDNMESDINAIGSCGNNCGSGPIQPSFCTSGLTIPNVPDIPNINKRQTPDDNTTYTLINGTDTVTNDTLFRDVFFNYTKVVCAGYYNLATNGSLPMDMQRDYLQQYLTCVISAQISFSADILIYGKYTEEYMDPLTFTSTGRLIFSAIGLARKLYYPIYAQWMCLGSSQFEQSLAYNQSTTMTNQCLPWVTVYEENNLTSPWVFAVGEFMELARESYENTTANKNNTFGFGQLLAAIWNGVSATKSFLFDIQPGANYSIYDSFFAAYNAYEQSLSNTTVKRFYTERIEPLIAEDSVFKSNWSEPGNLVYNLTRRWGNFKDYVYNGYATRRDKFYDAIKPKSKRAIKNRNSLENMRYVVSHMYKEYSHIYGVFKDNEAEQKYLNEERNLDMLYTAVPLDTSKISTVEDLTIAWMYASKLGKEKIKSELNYQMDVASGRRQAITDPFANLTTICGIPEIGGGTTCINCTILFGVLDQLVSRGLECFSISQNYFNLLNNEFLEPFIQSIPNPFAIMNSQTKGLASQWSLMIANQNLTEYEKAFEQNRFDMEAMAIVYNDVGTVGQNYSILINPTQVVVDYFAENIVEPIVQDILKINISIKGIINYIQYSLVNSSVSASNTAYYWLHAFVNSPPSMNCPSLAERGVGIGNLVISTGIVGIGMILLCAILGRISYTALAAVTPFFVFSPYLIMVVNYGISPFAFPAMPFCFADDIYGMLNTFDVDCVNWNNTLPGLTQPYCPDAGQSRTWADCSGDPYYMDNAFRVTFFFLQRYWPAAFDVIRYSNFVPLAAFRSIEGMYSLMFFPYEPNQATQDFMSCALLRVHNFYVLSLYMLVIGAVAVVLATFVLLVIILIGSVIYYIGIICVSIAGTLSGVIAPGESQGYANHDDYINSILVEFGDKNKRVTQVNDDILEPSSSKHDVYYGDNTPKKSNRARAYINAFISSWIPQEKKKIN